MSQIGKPPCDEGAILHGGAAALCSAAAQRWTLVAAILGSSMAFIDGTVANVALPALQRELDASAFEAQWVIESYALFLASLLLTGGALGDRFGRRRVFMLGVALFTAASVGCGLSRTVTELIVARSVQGIGAALLVPGSLALISANFPQAQRGAAIGTWSAFSGITAAVGPVVGGWLVDHYSWAWAFLVNAPIGAVLMIVCTLKVPESRGDPSRGGVDTWGAALATLGLAGVVFAFVEAPSRGWSSVVVWAPLLAGVIGLALFIRVEATGRAPMLPLALFRIRNFAGANVLTLLLYAALGGGLYFFPFDLIQVQGFGATAAGAAMLPFIGIMFALSGWAGRLVDRFGPRLPLMVGPVVAALGFALLAVPGVGADYWRAFFPAICVLGLGMSITVAPLTTTVMNAVGASLAGVASGVNNAVSRTAALLAIAVFGVVMAWAFDAALGEALTRIRPSPQALADLHAQRHKLAGIVLPAGMDDADASALKAAIGASFVAGFRVVMLLCAALAVLSALSAWLMIDGPAAGILKTPTSPLPPAPRTPARRRARTASRSRPPPRAASARIAPCHRRARRWSGSTLSHSAFDARRCSSASGSKRASRSPSAARMPAISASS
jgi:EmrB/QacA subfamily drug resistance transporter